MRKTAPRRPSQELSGATLRDAGPRGLLLALLLVAILALPACADETNQAQINATRVEVRDGSGNVLTPQSVFYFGSASLFAPTTETFTIVNRGPAMLLLESSTAAALLHKVEFGGDYKYWYFVTQEPPVTLKPNESGTFEVLFPFRTDYVFGLRPATMTLHSFQLDKHQYTFNITGTDTP